jgi:NADH dehydrogenase FAD-containing subunit
VTSDKRQEPAAASHRVVIIGGGFGGLRAAQGLKRAPVEVTLLDPALLPGAAT